MRTGSSFVCGRESDRQAQRAVVFNMLHNDMTTEVMVRMAEAVKAATSNKLMVMSFYGAVLAGSYPDRFAGNLGSFGYLSARKLLESPHFDAFCNPYTYSSQEREVTTPLPAMHLHTSMVLNGKLSIVEDDTRTMFDTSSDKKWCFNLSCTTAMIRRNAFTAALSNRGVYNFDLNGAGWLGRNGTAAERGNTSEIWSTVRGVADALKKADPLAAEGPLALPQVAVFFDERAPIVQPLDGFSQGAWSIDGMSQSLTRTGAGGQRYYYTDDLPKIASGALREGIKLAIFPNFFTGSPAVRAALTAWQGDAGVNTTFVFYGPAGIVQSEVRDLNTPFQCIADVSAVAKVTGISELIEHTGNHTSQVQMKANFTAAEKAAFPLIEALQTTSFGSSGGTISPLLTVASSPKPTPVDDIVFVLGHYGNASMDGPDSGVGTVGPPALVAKARQGGGHNIYSAANGMPSALLTTLLVW